MTPLRTRADRGAIEMLTGWMGEHYFRTFLPSDDDSAPFDVVLNQRDRRAGITIGGLGVESGQSGTSTIEELLTSDVEVGSYVLWVPPGAEIPADEPELSAFRVRVANGMRGLEANERREVRLPAKLLLAKTGTEGEYVSVTGELSTHWTRISEGVDGSFHLDSRALHRLPEEQAELDILISRVRDRAALLNESERTHVDVHDYWLVSRLPGDEPAGVTSVGAPPDFNPADGASIRRLLRQHISRATEQRQEGECDFSVILLIGAFGHMEDEMVTVALRGMNPTSYSTVALIALVTDGRVREILQPRSLPWA